MHASCPLLADRLASQELGQVCCASLAARPSPGCPVVKDGPKGNL